MVWFKLCWLRRGVLIMFVKVCLYGGLFFIVFCLFLIGVSGYSIFNNMIEVV